MGAVRPSPSATKAVAKAETKVVSLVEKFAIQMGGVDPHKMLDTLKATAFRQPAKRQGSDWVSPQVTNEQMMALLVVANKYDLNPFIKEIYAFPDKGGIVPIVGVDGWSRMINNHPQFDGIEFAYGDKLDWSFIGDDKSFLGIENKGLPESCTCIIYRKDRSHPTKVTEYLDEVYRAQYTDASGNPKQDNWGNVITGPWQTHTRRMLRHKAMIQCARLAFGFTGIHDQDEAERIIEGDFAEVEVEAKAQTLTDRFTTAPADDHIHDAASYQKEPEETEVVGEIITERYDAIEAAEPGEVEVIQSPPEVRLKKKKKNKAQPEKVVHKADISGDVMQKIIAAESVEVIDDILTEVEEFEGLSQAKRMIIKKAASARKKDL